MSPIQQEINGTNGHVKSSTSTDHKFDPIEDCVAAFQRGEFVIVLDDTSRENEGDLILAASEITTAKMGFLIRHSSGYVCAPVSSEIADTLDLPYMVSDNQDPHRTSYTVTVDAMGPDTTTGISAQDRAYTARALASTESKAGDFRRPGHVLPLRARPGGVRQRRGHTEAAVELCRLAGKRAAAVICEMVVDGEEIEGKPELVGSRMSRRDDCLAFGKNWGIKCCTIEDMVVYVEAKEGKWTA